MALSAKQRTFVAEYLKDKNAGRAAIAAGYSPKAAETNGPRLLRNAQIKAAVEKALVRVAEKAELKAADVLAEMRKLAFVKLKDAYDDDGKLLPLHEMPEDVQTALSAVESEELFIGKGAGRIKIGQSKKVKLFDKVKNLEMLAKYFKLLTDVSESRSTVVQFTSELEEDKAAFILKKLDDKI